MGVIKVEHPNGYLGILYGESSMSIYDEDGHKDRMRFDYPEEVLKRVIDFRTNRLSSSMGAEREKVLIYISKLLRDVRIVEDVMKDSGKKVLETRSKK